MYSILAYATFIFYLYSFFFYSPVESLCCEPKYRANIIHHFIFVFYLHYFYHFSCRKDQFTVLSLKFLIGIRARECMRDRQRLCTLRKTTLLLAHCPFDSPNSTRICEKHCKHLRQQNKYKHCRNSVRKTFAAS